MKHHRRYAEEEKKGAADHCGKSPGTELGLTRSVYYDWLEKAKTGSLADRIVLPGLPWRLCLRR